MAKYFLVILGLSFAALECKGDEPLVAVSAEAILVREEGAVAFTGLVELGLLEAGSEVIATLTFTNPTNVDLPCGSKTSHCRCIAFSANQKVIPPRSKGSFLLRFKVPKNSHTARRSLSIVISNPAGIKDSIEIEACYQISGLLSFSNTYHLLEISESVGEKWVALNVSAPIEFKNLTVEATKPLQDLVFDLVKEKGGFYVQVLASKKSVEDGPISGEVRIRDSVSGRRSGFYLTCQKADLIKVSPRVVRFSPFVGNSRGEKKSGKYSASVIVRLTPSQSKKNDQQLTHRVDRKGRIGRSPKSNSVPSKPRFHCRYFDDSVRLKVRSLGEANRIYRVEVILELDEDLRFKMSENESEPIWWLIRIGGENYKFSSPVVFKD